jgi:hypothetical protein
MKEPDMKRQRVFAFLAVLLIVLSLATAALAQSSGLQIDWRVMGTGGGSSSAGVVTINDTVGQPIVGSSASSDGQVVLGAGYWPSLSGAAITRNKVYLPLVQQ